VIADFASQSMKLNALASHAALKEVVKAKGF
jgi:hypothetical protein